MSTERPAGMGPGPIPISKVREYVRGELGLAGDFADWFVTLIRRMDDEYLVASSKTPGKGEVDPDKQIPADDVEGMRSMFRKKIQSSSKKPKPEPKTGKERT